MEAGARTWPRDGVPERPAAWLLTAARRRVLDRLRAEAMAARKEPLLVVDAEAAAARTGWSRADPGDLVGDEVLRLVLMCCHPALAPVRLARVTLALAPDEPVLSGLLALLLLQHSRRDARVDAAGRLVLLPDQDRSRWHHGEVAEALDVLSRMPPHLSSALAESYRLQALVASEHAIAATASDTRWDRICDHYATLVALNTGRAARGGGGTGRARRAARGAGRARRPRRGDAPQPPATRRAGELLARVGEARRGRRVARRGDRPLRQPGRARPPDQAPRRAPSHRRPAGHVAQPRWRGIPLVTGGAEAPLCRGMGR